MLKQSSGRDCQLELQSQLGQWFETEAVHGAACTVSRSWLLAVGWSGSIGEEVLLTVKRSGEPVEVGFEVTDEADEMGAGSIRVPWVSSLGCDEGLRQKWSQPVVQEQGFNWGAEDVDPLRTIGADACDAWWDQQSEQAMLQCLEGDAERVGGLFESDEVSPDERVLGSWCFGRLKKTLGELQPARIVEQTGANNPEWAKKRAVEQVFKAGSILEHRDAMAEFGADSQVLKWMDQSGYHVHLSEQLVKELGAAGEQAVGIDKPNGVRAREHEVELRLVIVEALLKGSYEVVADRSGVDNVIPANLAPKPSKEPPWRLISNAMGVNKLLGLWSVRYETLRTVPLVVKQSDWVFSIDLTDAYHQFLLTEESRRLFGHKLRLTHEQVVQLEQAGKLPARFTRVEVEPGLFEVFVRPVGIPMGFKNVCAIWTKIARVWTAKWRREGKRLVHLLDDFMFAVDGDLSLADACKLKCWQILKQRVLK